MEAGQGAPRRKTGPFTPRKPQGGSDRDTTTPHPSKKSDKPTAAELKKQEKERKAKEKLMYGYNITMTGMEMLECGKDLLQSRDFIFISLDLEMWELNSNLITEIGVAVLDMTSQKDSWMPNIDCFHIIPDEAFRHFNGRRLADKRGLFCYGKSLTMPMEECKEFWASLVDTLMAKCPNVYYIGQSVKDDLFCLNKNGFIYNRTLPVLDTQLIWESTSALPNSLVNMLAHLRIPFSFLHNAGNDAYLTMRVLMAILDPSVRKSYGLDIGPNAAEAHRIAYQHSKNKERDPDEFPVELTPEQEAHRKRQLELNKLSPEEKKKAIQKLKQERLSSRLQETKEDMPGKTIPKTAEQALADYLSPVELPQ